jgi:ligand-binding SRPBCC domain-containing protein
MPEAPNNNTYEKRTEMNTTLQRMVAFHEDPKALGKLSPPPIFMQLHRDDRESLTEGELAFTLWFGPIPIRWVARHEPGPTEHSFADLMIEGPMAYWRHEHIFEETADGVALIDRVTLSHKPGLKGLLTRLMFDGIPLRILFFYRHLRTRMAVSD